MTCNIIDRFLCRLLASANACPPIGDDRERFYAIKDRILRKRGKLIGEDIQHIVKPCWTCDASGIYGQYEDGSDIICNRCIKGIFDEFWVTLERWDWCGRIFHRPKMRYRVRPAATITIEGRIEHEYPKHGRESMLWLALLFDRKLLLNQLTRIKSCSGRTPMILLNRFVFDARMFLERCGLFRARCSCGRRVFRPFSRSYYVYCRQCDSRDKTEEIPF